MKKINLHLEEEPWMNSATLMSGIEYNLVDEKGNVIMRDIDKQQWDYIVEAVNNYEELKKENEKLKSLWNDKRKVEIRLSVLNSIEK